MLNKIIRTLFFLLPLLGFSQKLTIVSSTVSACDGKISVSVGYGLKPYTYTWYKEDTPGVWKEIKKGSSARYRGLKNLAVGNYKVIVTDSSTPKQSVESFFTMVVAPNLTIGEEFSNLMCKDKSNSGLFVGYFENGDAPYNWTIQDASDPSKEILGTHPDDLDALVLPKKLASGGAFFSFERGKSYILTWKDANGCESSHTFTIKDAPAPITQNIRRNQNVTCFGGSDGIIDLDVSGGWGNPFMIKYATVDKGGGEKVVKVKGKDWTALSDFPNKKIKNLKAGQYRIYYADSLRSPDFKDTHDVADVAYTKCDKFVTINITEPKEIKINTTAFDVRCHGKSTGRVTGTIEGGTAPYNITVDGTPLSKTVNTDGGSFEFTGLKAGTYNLTASDAKYKAGSGATGCKQGASVIIKQPQAFKATFVSKNNVVCFGSSNGWMSLKVTNGTPPYQFSFNGKNITPIVTGDEYLFTGLKAGNHTLIATDDCGVNFTFNQKISQPDEIKVTVARTLIKCNGGTDGKIKVTVKGGTPPYQLDLEGAKATIAADGGSHEFKNLAGKIYTLNVGDANATPAAGRLGCKKTQSVDLTPPDKISFTINGEQLRCKGDSDGNITGTISGGTPPYTIRLSVVGGVALPAGISKTVNTDGGNFDFSNLTVNDYQFTITDSNACTDATPKATITPPPALGHTIESFNNVSCFGGSDGRIGIKISGGTPPYSLTLDGIAMPGSYLPNIEYRFTGLARGNHTFGVEDACGEKYTATKNLTEPNALTIRDIRPIEQALDCFGNTNGEIIGTITGGTPPYKVDLTGAKSANVPTTFSNFDFNNLPAGDYKVTVTDDKGCTETVDTKITEPKELKVNSTGDLLKCFGDADGSIIGQITGGTPPYLVRIDGTAKSDRVTTDGGYFDLDNLVAGTYNITITDANSGKGSGCTVKKIHNVSQPPELTFVINGEMLHCKGDTDGNITGTISGGSPPYKITMRGSGRVIGVSASGDGFDFDNLSVGDYQFTITDANSGSGGAGCTKNASASITDPPIFQVAYEDHRNVSCFNGSDAWISIKVNGGTKPYTFTVNGVPKAPTNIVADEYFFGGLKVGNYEIIAGDDCSISHRVSRTLTQPAVLQILDIDVVEEELKCFGSSDGNIIGRVTGGTPPYTIAMTGAKNETKRGVSDGETFDFDNLTAGDYKLTVTDSSLKGCDLSVDTKITQPNEIGITIAGSALSCNGDADGTVTGTIVGGTPPYTIGLDGSVISKSVTASGGSFSFSGLKAGTHHFTIEDANAAVGGGCSKKASARITEPPAIAISMKADDVVLCRGMRGVVEGTITGGTPPYEVVLEELSMRKTITSSGDSFTFRNLNAGDYNITVTDANSTLGVSDGCVQKTKASVKQPDQFKATFVSQKNPSCAGGDDGNIVIEVTGGNIATYQFRLDGTVVLPSKSGNQYRFARLKLGNYTIVAEDTACGTTETIVRNLVSPSSLNVVTNTTHLICNKDSNGIIQGTIAGGTPPYKIEMVGKGITKNVPISGGAFQFTGLTAGSYEFKVTDANSSSGLSGCETRLNLNVREPNPISATGIGATLRCHGDADGTVTGIIRGGTPPYTITLDGTATKKTVNNEGDNYQFTGLKAGNYRFTITDKNSATGVVNGCTHNITVEVKQPKRFVARLFDRENVSCLGGNDGKIVIEAKEGTKNYRFTLNGVPTTPTVTGNKYDFNNLRKGNYTVVATDDCGVTQTISTSLTEPAKALSTTLTADAYKLACKGDDNGIISATVSGGTPPYTVSVERTVRRQVVRNDGDAFRLTGFKAGSYTILIVDNNGCSIRSNTRISEPASAITITAKATAPTCDPATGRIELTIAGGEPPYTVRWDDLGLGRIRTGLTSGDYEATVTDSNGCEKKQSVTVPATAIFSSTLNTTNITCFGEKDGQIEITLNGGEAPFKIIWEDGSRDGLVRSNLSKGTYKVSIADVKGCTIDHTILITEPNPLNIIGKVTHIERCDKPDSGEIELTITGGTPPYTFKWSDSSTNQDLKDAVVGIYKVTVTDKNSCTATKTFEVLEYPELKILISQKEIFDCDKRTTTTENTLEIEGGYPPYTVVWTGGDVDAGDDKIMRTNTNGSYTATVTDAKACKRSATVQIKENIPLRFRNFTYTSFAITTFGEPSIMDDISFKPNQIDDGIAYLWDFGDGITSAKATPKHSYTEVGDYNVKLKVTYPNGCTYNYAEAIKVGKGYEIMLPDVFTPNADGINDVLQPLTKGIEYIEFRVVNQWGEIVYTEKGKAIKGWDGNVEVNGNYMIIIKATTFYGGKVQMDKTVKILK